jgi:hypothetical protein
MPDATAWMCWDGCRVGVCVGRGSCNGVKKVVTAPPAIEASASTPRHQLEAGATRATPWHDDQAGALCLRQSTAASISIMEGLYYNVKYGYATRRYFGFVCI